MAKFFVVTCGGALDSYAATTLKEAKSDANPDRGQVCRIYKTKADDAGDARLHPSRGKAKFVRTFKAR